jgi:hypothetical protein
MPHFKYTVTNQEGKKLSGSAEAPDAEIARQELNNLGFSVLNLEETQDAPKINPNLKKFVFEAIDKNAKTVSGSIPAQDKETALQKIQTEYNLNVTALWQEGAALEEITQARAEGTANLNKKLQEVAKDVPKENAESPEKQKEKQFIRTKIEHSLSEVNELLQKFDKEISPDEKSEIHKRIDKVLRIKNSNNLDYILSSTEDLLNYMQKAQDSAKDNSFKEQRFQMKIETKKMLRELHTSSTPKSISEDIIGRIETWQESHITEDKPVSDFAKFINKTLNKIKSFFTSQPEILAIKEEIRSYNKQLWEFVKLYFKEPTPDYKEKVKNSLKTIWKKRKDAKLRLKELKAKIREKNQGPHKETNLLISFLEEVNSLSGWLLTFYIAYYFIALYINTKDFGISEIPVGFEVYESSIFKYALVILFALHTSTALKINFFRESYAADIALPILFISSSLIAVLNF